MQADYLPFEPPGKPIYNIYEIIYITKLKPNAIQCVIRHWGIINHTDILENVHDYKSC